MNQCASKANPPSFKHTKYGIMGNVSFQNGHKYDYFDHQKQKEWNVLVGLSYSRTNYRKESFLLLWNYDPMYDRFTVMPAQYREGFLYIWNHQVYGYETGGHVDFIIDKDDDSWYITIEEDEIEVEHSGNKRTVWLVKPTWNDNYKAMRKHTYRFNFYN